MNGSRNYPQIQQPIQTGGHHFPGNTELHEVVHEVRHEIAAVLAAGPELSGGAEPGLARRAPKEPIAVLHDPASQARLTKLEVVEDLCLELEVGERLAAGRSDTLAARESTMTLRLSMRLSWNALASGNAPDARARAHIHPLPLVIPPRGLVDLFKCGYRTREPRPHGLPDLRLDGHKVSLTGIAFRGSCRRTQRPEGLGHPRKSLTILAVVLNERLFQGQFSGRLPRMAPHDGLASRSVCGGPGEAQEVGDLFEAVGMGREVNLRVDLGEKVHGGRDRGGGCGALGGCPVARTHPREKRRLETAVVDQHRTLSISER